MKRALTFVEMVAVVVLAAMIAVVAGQSLTGSQEHAQLLSVTSRLKELDAAARLLARTGVVGALELDQSGTTFVFKEGAGELLLERIDLPIGYTWVLEIDNKPQFRLLFDSRGRTPDYRLTMIRKTGELAIAWRVCGLTGWIIPESESR